MMGRSRWTDRPDKSISLSVLSAVLTFLFPSVQDEFSVSRVVVGYLMDLVVGVIGQAHRSERSSLNATTTKNKRVDLR